MEHYAHASFRDPQNLNDYKGLFIDVSAERVESLRISREFLSKIYEFESNWLMLEENYEEFGQAIASAGRDRSGIVTSHRDRADCYRLLNRRLINLLTTFRLYVEQTKEQLKIREPFDKAYQQHSAYRAVWELRNFAQHTRTPIVNMSAGSGVGIESYFRVHTDAEGLGGRSTWPRNWEDPENLAKMLHLGLPVLADIHGNIRETLRPRVRADLKEQDDLLAEVTSHCGTEIDFVEIVRRGRAVLRGEWPTRAIRGDDGLLYRTEDVFQIVGDFYALVGKYFERQPVIRQIADWRSKD